MKDQSPRHRQSGAPLRLANSRRDNLVERMTLAREERGPTPTHHLKWVLGFIRQEIATLEPKERARLWDCLRWIPSPDPGARWSYRPIPDPVKGGLLRRLQSDIRHGIQNVLRTRQQRWELPGPQRAFIHRFAEEPGSKVRTFGWGWVGDEPDMVRFIVAQLVFRHGERLRLCKSCTGAFVAVKRQEYCTTLCSQKMRDQRKKTST